MMATWLLEVKITGHMNLAWSYLISAEQSNILKRGTHVIVCAKWSLPSHKLPTVSNVLCTELCSNWRLVYQIGELNIVSSSNQINVCFVLLQDTKSMLRIPAFSMAVLLGNFDQPGDVADVLETALVEVHMCVDYSLFQFYFCILDLELLHPRGNGPLENHLRGNTINFKFQYANRSQILFISFLGQTSSHIQYGRCW